MDDPDEAHKRGSPYDRLLALVFQGHPPRPYLKASFKLLAAGFLGLVVGDVAQQIITPMTGWPYALTYIIGALFGFVVNLRAQVKMKNLNVSDRR